LNGNCGLTLCGVALSTGGDMFTDLGFGETEASTLQAQVSEVIAKKLAGDKQPI
jgi:hypothetical protein